MNPTVSVTSTSLPFGSGNLRVVGSRVANSWFSAYTSAAVNTLRSELFPALVYPTSEMTGTGVSFLRSR